jgi:hypothetical protein
MFPETLVEEAEAEVDELEMLNTIQVRTRGKSRWVWCRWETSASQRCGGKHSKRQEWRCSRQQQWQQQQQQQQRTPQRRVPLPLQLRRQHGVSNT